MTRTILVLATASTLTFSHALAQQSPSEPSSPGAATSAAASEQATSVQSTPGTAIPSPNGTVTGQGQAGWSVAGTSQYVVYAGEFPGVNNKAQAGLARFAVPASAPNLIGPDDIAYRLTLAGSSIASARSADLRDQGEPQVIRSYSGAAIRPTSWAPAELSGEPCRPDSPNGS